MITARSQRWRDKRDRFVPASSVIDPARFAVDVVSCPKVAKPFVRQHHYSGTFPASRLSVGLFENGVASASRLVGVATISVPMNNAAVPKHAGRLPAACGAELGRFVILDHVAGNGETWFLKRALRLLRREKPEILSVIAYADPMERRGPDGQVSKPGHVGGIYAAFGAAYRGRTRPRTELTDPTGTVVSERAMSKIRNDERGAAYASEALLLHGAPRPDGASGSAWLAELRASGWLRRRRHPGNHVYAFGLTKAARLAGRDLPSLTYPILDRASASADATELPLLAA